MLRDNTKEVNKIIATNMAWCSLVVVAMMVTTWIGIFNFNTKLKVIIIAAGFAATLMPLILLKCKVHDTFLKYYILIAISVFIALVGMNNGVGIYITYALVPIASCLYLDRRFTLKIGLISYLTMALGVYVNCAGKLEVKYLEWTHMITFRNYMIGFTLEYVVVMLFLYQIVKRSQAYMESQQENIRIITAENERRKKMAAVYSGNLSSQRKSAYDMLSRELENFTQEEYTKLAAGRQFVSALQESFKYTDDFDDAIKQVMSQIGDYFHIDRILYVEIGQEPGTNRLAFQWCQYPEDVLTNFYTDMDPKEVESISSIYDSMGYIEIDDPGDYFGGETNLQESGFTGYMRDHSLGAQLWIPTLLDGRYNGAACFDKYSKEPYSVVDKFLLSEIVNTISVHLNRIKADNANHAKSNFLSTMSHEIRTPMNAILGMTTVALREDMNDTVRRSLKIIKSSSEGLLTIINDILDISKIESGKIEIIEEKYQILSLLNDLSTIANARNAEKGLELIYDVPEDLPTELYGDMVRVKQVMVNLANNAIKYTDSGSVTISVRVEKTEDGTDHLKYRVTDTGQGIREEDKGKLFRSFSQINQEQNHHKEGTGLGLAISKQLIELMNGTIGVDSEFGKGSTFYFEVPQKVTDATPAGKMENFDYGSSDAQDAMPTYPEARVLIVDDNEINLMVAQSLMEPFEMQIETADSGEMALRLLEKNTYDLIFMDNFMPGMNGEETAAAIRALSGNPNRDVTIVALTADAVTGVKEKMLAAGMNDFLCKPINMKHLEGILRKYLK